MMLPPLRSPVYDRPLHSAIPGCRPAALRLGMALCMAGLLAGCHSVPLQSSPTSQSNEALERYSVADQQIPNHRSKLTQEIAAASITAPIGAALDSSVDRDLPWLDIIHPHYNQARTLVERELNVDLSHVQLLIVDDSPINAEVSRETQRLVNEQFGDTNFADLFLAKVMQTQSGTYAALFSSRLQAVMISRNMLANYEQSLPADPKTRNAALLTLLIHELVHAADEDRYQIHKNRALNFRASFAQSATFEGHAQWVTRRICEKNDCLTGLNALDNFMFSRTPQHSRQLTQPVEAISRNVLEYSYIEGERFISSIAARENGEQLIEDLLRSPPYDPIQILAPDSFPDVEREHRNQRLISATLEIDHPWVADPWIAVETSPLKGVNLRADPSRRQAAVDGFTRLIQSMVAMQLYDSTRPNENPIDITLLHAESAHTASLFARTLYENTLTADTLSSEEPLRVNTGAGHAQSHMTIQVFRSALENPVPYRTTVAVTGPYVVQIAGVASNADTLEDYALRVLLKLQLSQ